MIVDLSNPLYPTSAVWFSSFSIDWEAFKDKYIKSGWVSKVHLRNFNLTYYFFGLVTIRIFGFYSCVAVKDFENRINRVWPFGDIIGHASDIGNDTIGAY